MTNKEEEDKYDLFYEEVEKLAKKMCKLEEEELDKIAKKYDCEFSDIIELYAECQQRS